MRKKLKPCPLCGNKNIEIVTDNLEYSLGLVDFANFKVICSTTSCGCGATSDEYSDPDEAIEAWNRWDGVNNATN